jgi:hypothetical protein
MAASTGREADSVEPIAVTAAKINDELAQTILNLQSIVLKLQDATEESPLQSAAVALQKHASQLRELIDPVRSVLRPESFYQAGMGAAADGRLELAARLFRRALELRTDYPQARKALDDALRKQGQISFQTCRKLWLTLNKTQLQPIKEWDAHRCKEWAENNFRYIGNNLRPKIINLYDLNVSDITYLAEHGISYHYLSYNLQKTMMTGGHFDPLAFQLTAVNEKAIYAVCPFTGKLVTSHHSLLANINVIFYRFESVQVFYVITAGLDGFKKNAIYFPQQELVVTTGMQWGFEEDDLIEMQRRMVGSFDASYGYLSKYKLSNRKVAVCIGFYHFAHHLWNELPGIERLVRKGMIDSVDKFLVLREPLGDLRQIFPEIPASKIERKTTTDALFEEIVTNDYFVVRIGDYAMSSDTASRVYNVARKNCRPETLDKVQDARRKHSPLLWIGIRAGSRMWVNQVDGLARLIDRLHTEFPDLGVVFDGFSLPAHKSDEWSNNHEFDEIVRQENQVVSGIIENLKQCRRQASGIFNIVGSSIYDANVWAHAIDVYVSPHGTLQHKVGWLANNPGVIHTNTTRLDWRSDYIWTAVEHGIKPRYVPRTAVRDVPSIEKKQLMEPSQLYAAASDYNESGAGILSHNRRIRDWGMDDYELDWLALYSDLVDLIRSYRMMQKLDQNISHTIPDNVNLFKL